MYVKSEWFIDYNLYEVGKFYELKNSKQIINVSEYL